MPWEQQQQISNKAAAHTQEVEKKSDDCGMGSDKQNTRLLSSPLTSSYLDGKS
jgi:hypothetical protein